MNGTLLKRKLGGMFPQTGGQVVYLEKAFSPWAGFRSTRFSGERRDPMRIDLAGPY